MTKDETQLSRIKAGLKCSDAEAAEILAYDKAIDHGEKTPHDLTPAQNKVAQSYARTGTRKPTVYKFTTRERKPNEPKREIIQVLVDALTPICDSMEVTNAERQLDFDFHGVKYRVVLSAPRK
jgi:hypothetical protein